MAYKLTEGDYVKKSDGSFETAELTDEVLQNMKLALFAYRGKFYPDKSFGSRLRKISSELLQRYALAYARQALDSFDGVYVLKAEVKDSGVLYTVLVNDEKRQVKLNGII